MAATAVTLNDPEGHSPVAGLFKCNLSNICAAFYTISTDSVLAWFLCVSGTSCMSRCLVLLQSTRVTDRRTDRQTDGQHYDSQDRASIAYAW